MSSNKQPPYGWRLLADSSDKSLVKVLFEVLAGPDETPLELYRTFLRSTFNPAVSCQDVAMLDNSTLGRFYDVTRERQDPKFCRLFVGNDLAKMECAAGKKVVLLAPAAQGNFRKIHDRRCLGLLAGDGGCGAKEAVFLLLVHVRKAKWLLYERESGGFPHYLSVFSEVDLFWISHEFQGCLLRSVRRALLAKVGVEEEVPDDDSHVHSQACSTLTGLVHHDLEAMLAVTGGVGFTLVSHVGTKMLAKSNLAQLPENNTFAVLAKFESSAPEAETSLTNPVLCVNADLRIFLLKKPYADRVRERQVRPRHAPTRPEFPSPLSPKKNKESEKTKRKANPPPPLSPPPLKTDKPRKCPCAGCASAPSWEANMSKNGNQYPYKCDLGIHDLMGSLGRRTPALDATLDRCLAISAASFDVESVGVPLDDSLGNEDERGDGEDGFLDEPPVISETKRSYRAYAVQRPCLIGFVTQMMLEVGQPPLIFRASKEEFYGGAEEGVDQELLNLKDSMEGRFLEAVFKHRNVAREMKQRLLQSEFDWLRDLRTGHFEFYKAKGFLPESFDVGGLDAVRFDGYYGQELTEFEMEALLELDRELEEQEERDNEEEGEDGEEAAAATSSKRGSRMVTAAGLWRSTMPIAKGVKRSATTITPPPPTTPAPPSRRSVPGDFVHLLPTVPLPPTLSIDHPANYGEFLARQRLAKEEDARARRDRLALMEDSEEEDREIAFQNTQEQVALREKAERERVREQTARDKKRVAGVRASWKNGYLGRIEGRLRRIVVNYCVFAFNASSYDLLVLGSRLCVYAKEVGRCRLSMAKEGRSWRFLNIGGARFSEIKMLLSPGTSLAQLGATCHLDTEENLSKGLFPFDAFTTLEFLDEPNLPPLASQWQNVLSPLKSPSQAEVDEVLAEYRALNCQTVFDYISVYLSKDCNILMRAITKMQAVYFDILGINFLDVLKFTTSSYASYGVQCYLARHCLPGFSVPNHCRVFGLLKTSGCRGGLTGVTRTAGGSSLDTEPFETLLEKQMLAEEEEVKAADASMLGRASSGRGLIVETLRGRLRRLGLTPREYVMGINSHLCDNPKPGTHLIYTDCGSLYAAAAKNSLPYGEFTLFDRVYGEEDFSTADEDSRGSDGETDLKKRRKNLKKKMSRRRRKLEKKKKKKEEQGKEGTEEEEEEWEESVLRQGHGNDAVKRPCFADTLEGLTTQFLLLEGFPRTQLAFGSLFAGHGQTCLGSNPRRLADLMLAGPEVNSQGATTGRQALKYFNVDGLFWHGDGNHLDSCSKKPLVYSRNSRLVYDRCNRDDENDLKTEYCRWMSNVHPEELVLTFAALHECEVAHGSHPPDLARWGGFLPPAATAKREERRLKYSSVRRLLAAEHPRRSLLGWSHLPRQMTQRDLVRRILAEDFCSVGGELGGFICLSLGRETSFEDFGENRFAFLHQRTTLEPRHVGRFTRLQARLRQERTGTAGPLAGSGENSDDFLDRLAARPGTFVRSSLHGEGETVGIDLFRFWVLERGFRGYRVDHAIIYRQKKYLTPFLEDLLLRRHVIREMLGSGLLSGLLKLCINGFFGYCSITQTSFTRTRVVGETTLAKYPRNHRLSATAPDLKDIALLGAVRKFKKKPELLYMLTMNRPNEKISNCLQVSSCILSESRNIMLGMQLVFLRYFAVEAVECCYHDTDSLIMLTADPDLSKCMKPHLAHLWPEVSALLFQDPRSEKEQSGKLKIEGVWRGGLFRSSKSYLLWDATEDTTEDVVVRLRGIPRKAHGYLEAKHYTQDPTTNTASIRTSLMQATAGNQMMNLRATKTMGHEYNFKRRAVDCVHTLPLN